MPTDSSTLIWCIGLPAIITVIACLVCRFFAVGSDGEATARRQTILSAILAVAWSVSVACSLRATDSIAALVDIEGDAWPKIFFPMLAIALLVSPHAITKLRSEPGLWVLVGGTSVLAATVVMPNGDGWTDMLPLHQPWIAAVTLAAICNAWALHRMAIRGAVSWLPLIILAGIACPAMIGAATYAVLLQTCFGAIVSTIVIAIFSGFGRLTVSPAIVFPSVLFMAAMIATGRFYSYADTPPIAYGIALFAPSLIALSDRMVSGKHPVVRIGVAAVTAILVVAFVGYRFLID